ncbi:MAG: ABC-2 family transporter protein [Candidatus Amesbacteria bacterium]|nr:ABC-2 family transporter protein [Candidatus Amesbacteria bacterium]
MKVMEYRVNFITWTIVDIGWILMDFVFISALISNIKMIGNWNQAQVIIGLGTFRLLVFPVWGWMFQSFNYLPKSISEGKLDMYLTKPLDAQFLVSFREFSFSIFPSIVGGLGFIVLGISQLEYLPNIIQLIFFVGITIVSIFLIYGIYFSTMTLVLYTDRLNNIANIFTSLYDASRFPKEIYGIFLQRIFTSIIPIALIVVIPAEALFLKPNWLIWVWMLMLAITFNLVGRYLWTEGLKRYSSASS